jgi:putative aldouronate transport system permease protein
MAPQIAASPGVQYALRRSRRRAVIRARYLFLMLIPGVVYFVMFRYAPMFGLVIAFKDFSIFKGIAGSPWVGLDNFRDVFSSPDFWNVLRNTLVISAYKIVFGFPVPIILALAMNEMRNPFFKRTVQTVIYLPYFISWVVIGGIILTIFSPTTGFLSQVTASLTGNRMNILASRAFFRPILVLSDIWKSAGWGTIIYLAALSQVDPNLYEAAIVDGANRWQQTVHITLPTISGVIVLLLILRIGWIMYAGFEQILVLQNAIVRDISDVFETFVYRVGLGKGEYTFTATAELFKSVVSLALVVAADRFAKLLGEEGLI